MQISTFIDNGDIIEALTRGCGEDSAVKFVIDLDAAMGDEGFTEELLLALAQSYEKEYIAYEESLVGKVLESTFIDTASAPGRLEAMRSSFEDASSKRNKLSQIVTLIKSLDDNEL